jgi:hypothetical protein
MKASLFCTLAFAVFLSSSLPKTVFSLASAEKSAAAKSESTSLDPGAWGYNPSTNTSWTTQQGHGCYAQWGTSTVTRGDQTIQAGHVVTNYGSTGVVKGQDNLYAAHDGNVYKRDDNGDWSKWDNGQRNPVNPPSRSSGTNQPKQNNLSSQNQETNLRNAAGASTPSQLNDQKGGAQTEPPSPKLRPGHLPGTHEIKQKSAQTDRDSRRRNLLTASIAKPSVASEARRMRALTNASNKGERAVRL